MASVDIVQRVGAELEACAAGVVFADGTVVTLADEPKPYPPTVKVGGNGQR
jgi:hypothetical protein